MADYGMRLLGDNYQIVLDSNFKNFELHHRARHYIQGGVDTGGEATEIRFDPIDHPPVIAAELTDSHVAFLGLNKEGGQYVGAYFIAEEGGQTVDLMVFAPAKQETGPGWGMRVWNADGEMVYDSNKRYMEHDGTANDGDWVGSGLVHYGAGSRGGYKRHMYHRYAKEEYRYESYRKAVREYVCETHYVNGYPVTECYYTWVYIWVKRLYFHIIIEKVIDEQLIGVRRGSDRLRSGYFTYRLRVREVLNESDVVDGTHSTDPSVLGFDPRDWIEDAYISDTSLTSYGNKQPLALISVQD